MQSQRMSSFIWHGIGWLSIANTDSMAALKEVKAHQLEYTW